MRFLYPQYFWLLGLIPGLWFGYIWSWNQRQKWLRDFGNIHWSWCKLTVHVPSSLGLILAILALTRPQYALQVTYPAREGIDLVCGIDVSPSMLAEDVDLSKATEVETSSAYSLKDTPISPNRLQRVKRAIYDLTQILQGEKVALFLFSSKSSKVLPLSSDYDSLRFYLDFYLDSYHISAKGTDLRTAIEMGSTMFQEDSRYKVLILFSDGELEEEEDLKRAVEVAQSIWLHEGVRIYTVGVGSEQGVLIPIRNNQGSISGYLRDSRGNFVRTQASSAALNKIAQVGGGQAYHLGAHRQNTSTDEVIIRLMNNILEHAQGIKTIQRVRTEYRDLFPHLFLLALGFLGGRSLISGVVTILSQRH